ncbi:hypothetical protein C8F04DRAFT_1322506 [Mycena alexandri]|uniref:F-box domain-containing protein n=1 Tax=Mycena alexandri TaxID=1745969 RepID=A0AAD6TJB5_9AGAR|nr:hypothetical protein C8F04DRAFT_1322506 [Mycena alexandri]
MAHLPQELIDAIIHRVEDKPSIKACSIVASQFRESAQRILFGSLVPIIMCSDLLYFDHKVIAALALLEESPHLAPYITKLHLCLRQQWGGELGADIQRLDEFLGRLMNVRRCVLEGTPQGMSMPEQWTQNLGPVVPTIMTFLKRQQLSELHVLRFDLPFSAMPLLASSPAAVLFENVGVSLCDDDISAVHGTSNLQQLSLGFLEQWISLSHSDVYPITVVHIPSDRIYRQLAIPFFCANLRKLCLRPLGGYDRVVDAAAHTLEHIRFDMEYFSNPPSILPLPPLPALRTIDFKFRDQAMLGEFSPHVATILTSRPIPLEEFSITSSVVSNGLQGMVALGSAVSSVLVDGRTFTRIRWRFGLKKSWQRSPVSQTVEVGRVLENVLREVHAQGKLFVEEWDVDGEDGW